VAERPDEQLKPNRPSFNALELCIAKRSLIDDVAGRSSKRGSVVQWVAVSNPHRRASMAWLNGLADANCGWGNAAMTRWIVFAGLVAMAIAASLLPAAAACSGVTERRLLPNGRFENVTRQDCYPDLHSAPMSNSPPDLAGPAGSRCRNVQERVLQPNGKFHTRSVQRCS
jgi:hypothetical protein